MKWHTIGISVPDQITIGGKEFLQTTIDAFKILVKDAAKETKDKVKALPQFPQWSLIVK